MPAIATGHNIGARSGCTLPLSLRRTRTGRNATIMVASKISHGTNSTRLRLPVRLRGRAPINPPRKLGITRSHNPPLPRTPVNRFRVRQTAVGYEANPATALVASAVIGPTTSKQRERYQSTATGYCINNSPNNAREEKQNAGCHDLAFFFFLRFRAEL